MKVTPVQYAKTLLELTDGKSEQEISGIVKSFAQQLKKDSQLKNAKAVMEKFEELYNKKHGIVQAEVVTKYKIQDTKYKEIEDFIKSKYKAEKVEMINTINESIKGGIIIKVGDEILDATVEGQLKRLYKLLIKN